MGDTINVLMCGNKNYLDGLTISVLSMIKHTTRPINLIFFTMDLSYIKPQFLPMNKECGEYVENILKSKNKNSKFQIIDCTENFTKKGSLIESVNLKNKFTPYAMLRLLVDEYNMPDKFIYLDIDVMVNNDLAQLYDYDIPKDCELGVVQDAYRIKEYFNSGMLLVNYKECKKTGLFKKAREICIHKKLIYTDQTALNMAVQRKCMLPLKFNAKDKYFPEIVIHHFCNVRKKNNFFHRVKPWEVDLVKQKMSVYNDILDDYLRRKPEIAKIKTA